MNEGSHPFFPHKLTFPHREGILLIIIISIIPLSSLELFFIFITIVIIIIPNSNQSYNCDVKKWQLKATPKNT